MADHLGQMIEEVAAGVPGVCVVQHLEAVNSKEESLLLLLGQARLAEGREFAPQADRLLSIALTAKNAKGKPIENRGIHLTPPTTRDCGLSNESNGAGSTCTACWTKR